MVKPKVRLLIIDGNTDNTNILLALIGEAFSGAIVLTALCGQQGIELAAAEDPDAILMDMAMPDSFDVCRALKSDQTTRDIPVVFVTASSRDAKSRAAALQCGADAFLYKPVDVSELDAQIRAMVKVKGANTHRRDEKNRRERLAEERTAKRKNEHKQPCDKRDRQGEDVAENNRLAEALRESENLYKSFVDASMDMVFLKDDQFRNVVVNRHFAAFLQKSEDEIIGKTDFDLMPARIARVCRKTDREVLSCGHLRLFVEHIDGRVYETIKFPVTMVNQKIGVGGFMRDITGRKEAEETIGRERERAQEYLDIARVIIVALDRRGNITLINREGWEKLGVRKEDIIGKNWVDCFLPEDIRSELKQGIKRILTGDFEDFETHENLILTADGERLISWRNTVLRDGDGNIDGILSSGIDITEQRMAQESLRESERSKSVLLSHIPGLAYRCEYDREWTMRFLSDGCHALTGYEPEDLLDNSKLSYNDLVCAEYRKELKRDWDRVVAKKSTYKGEYQITTASGERKWVLEMGQPIFDADGEVEALEGIVIDIDESKERYTQIQYMNDHDFLTGLFNRRYFEEAKALCEKEEYYPVSVIMADINGVRLINDAFGHVAGDQLIKQTAEIIRGCCGEDDVLARTGGDEFSILLPRTNQDRAYDIIRQIKIACDRYNTSVDEKTGFINLSLGLGVTQATDQGINEAVVQAEEHLYRSKLLDRKSHHSAILSSVMATMYARSRETEEHAERMAAISRMIGSKINLPQRDMDDLQLLAMLHDIGKVGVDDRILNKPGKLTDEEWAVMKKHPEIGYRIAMSSPDFESIAEYILAHHERWDGNGYPRGMKGEEIPLLSRILAVADAYDAMTEDRVYRQAMSHDAAMEEMNKNAGSQFDPDIVHIFINNFSRINLPQ